MLRVRPAIGILAGGGPLPSLLAKTLSERGQPFFIVGFEGFVEQDLIENYPHIVLRLAAAGSILRSLREHNCRDLVLIGPVKRPSWRDLRPDREGTKILARLGKAIFKGDDGLLTAIMKILEEEGFSIKGAHEFLKSALGDEGVMGEIQPSSQSWSDIKKAAHILTVTAPLDVGQGCVVKNGVVLAIEAIEGTDAMLDRCRDFQQDPKGGILLKMPKEGQDIRADMPAIGPVTIEKAAKAGLEGIAFMAGQILFTHREFCRVKADQHGIFLYGLSREIVHEWQGEKER